MSRICNGVRLGMCVSVSSVCEYLRPCWHNVDIERSQSLRSDHCSWSLRSSQLKSLTNGRWRLISMRLSCCSAFQCSIAPGHEWTLVKASSYIYWYDSNVTPYCKWQSWEKHVNIYLSNSWIINEGNTIEIISVADICKSDTESSSFAFSFNLDFLAQTASYHPN